MTGSERLLPLKLAIPRPPRAPVHRPRLVELLSRGLDARLVLVSAPPGFGKTTALADWLDASGIPCAWISLEPADNEPGRFLRCLWAGASVLATGQAGTLSDGALGTDAAAVIGEIALTLGEQERQSLVVLDDYHVITAPEVHRAVALLVERLPAGTHLVIATREDPALPLSRLRARGELVEVRADALRFTATEARTFMGERMGIALSDEDLGVLMARTEGWPAVLQLAGLSLAGRTDISRRVGDFAASHRFVLDYVTDEVLARLDDGDRSFLMATSILRQLSGSLCDALTGRSDGQATLERLERANVLLVPLDDERRWYRYHHLFADLLRTRLALADAALPGALHARAAAWYAERGLGAEAIDHALLSGDVDLAMDHLVKAGGGLIHAGRFEALLSALDRLPRAALGSHFRLSTFYALSLVLAGRTDGVDEHLADAEAALPAAAAAGAPGASIQPAYHALIRSIRDRLEHDPASAITYAEKALPLAPPGAAPLLADIQATLGLALLDAGETERAIEACRAARPAVRQAGNWIAVADITRNLARLEAKRGHLRAALDICAEALLDLTESDGREMPAAARVHVAKAEILERLGDAATAVEVERATELARLGGDLVSLREARAIRDRLAAGPLRTPPGSSLVEPLTVRELEVLKLVAAGRSNRQIAAELFVTVSTVKSHVHTASGKLGAESRGQAVARGRELGFLA